MRVFTILFWMLLSMNMFGQTFQKVLVPAGSGHAVNGSKEGGFAWGDINQDGFTDLVVLRSVYGLSIRIIWSDANEASPSFDDLTATKCPECISTNSLEERSALLADVNHDTYPDLIVNGMGSIRFLPDRIGIWGDAPNANVS